MIEFHIISDDAGRSDYYTCTVVDSEKVGFLLTYDSRDIPANAYKGIYLDFRGLMYQKFLGGDNNFYRLEMDYRQYKRVGNRKVIAWTAQTKNVFGDVPMNQYALSGTPFSR